jgi:hypothetical protein
MTQPAHDNPAMITLPLRLTAIVAGYSVILLRAWMDPRLVVLTLLFYLTPYLFIVFAPRRREADQIGFAVGYSISIQIAVLVALVLSLELYDPGSTSSPRIPAAHFSVLRYANVAVTVAAILAWIWNRKSINHANTAAKLALGVAYPFGAFLFEMILGHLIYD